MTSLNVRYFASLREALGPGETVQLTGPASVATLREALLARGGRYAEVLARDKLVRVAVDRVMVAGEALALEEGAEVAFFPPVTGG